MWRLLHGIGGCCMQLAAASKKAPKMCNGPICAKNEKRKARLLYRPAKERKLGCIKAKKYNF
jgi:hypothetical protein